jgi:transposase
VLTVEDWAEIRRLHRAEKMPVKAIVRTLGISRNTVRAALASDVPPRYERKPAGSAVDAFEPRIRELLAAYPAMPATVIAERIGWERGLTVLKDRIRELRPAYLPPDPASRTAYDPGELAQCDFWFPPVTVPAGAGQERGPARLPVLTMVSAYSRWLSAVLVPSRQSQDLFAGWWQLIRGLGGVPRALVWDGEGAIGRWRGGRPELTAECQAFRGTLGTKVVVCRPADPEAKGLVERANGYLETSFLPGRRFASPADFNAQLAEWTALANTRTAGRWAAPRPTGSPLTGRPCFPFRRWRRRPGGGHRCGCPAITTSGWTPATTPCTRRRSAAGSRSSPGWTGCRPGAAGSWPPTTSAPGPATRSSPTRPTRPDANRVFLRRVGDLSADRRLTITG